MRPPAWTSPASALRAGIAWTTVTSRPLAHMAKTPFTRVWNSADLPEPILSCYLSLAMIPTYLKYKTRIWAMMLKNPDT
jgi:hypothetical protein